MSPRFQTLLVSIACLLLVGCSSGDGQAPSVSASQDGLGEQSAPSLENGPSQDADAPSGDSVAAATSNAAVSPQQGSASDETTSAPDGTMSVAEVLENASEHLGSVVQGQGPIHSMGSDWATIGSDEQFVWLKLGTDTQPMNAEMGDRIVVEGTFEEAMSQTGETNPATVQRIRINSYSIL